ncbi:flagellar motor protein MotB [Gluconobacter morbifer]|uniref:Chemotaxis MotB protein n=1 Tax=Gluconobacter morbifer G707 TaxID=1088869 RepID=G6XII0_9PROT|nr:flagellar motor protein MotB [Gluconobacter morbifer]EHH68620.1 chemotaxis MotB protein [Gluconobacter morbifer G707]
MSNNGQEQKVIIKRFDVVAGGHHGGSWKIAYADFVTAMMAFFLVMWLINATTEQQRRGIASFFNPIAADETSSPLETVIPPVDSTPKAETNRPLTLEPGRTEGIHPDDGTSGRQTSSPRTTGIHSAQIVVLHDNQVQPGEAPVTDGPTAQEHAARIQAASQIRKVVSAASDLADVQSQVTVRAGDDGLHVEIADTDHQPMFALGQARPDARTVRLLRLIVPYLERLHGQLSVAGYTDAAPFRPGQPSNWSLSSARAVSVRDILVQSGFPDRRLRSVSGYADRNLFDPAHPLDPRNRRIVLVLSTDAP